MQVRLEILHAQQLTRKYLAFILSYLTTEILTSRERPKSAPSLKAQYTWRVRLSCLLKYAVFFQSNWFLKEVFIVEYSVKKLATVIIGHFYLIVRCQLKNSNTILKLESHMKSFVI